MTILIALDDGHGLETSGKRTPAFPDGTVMKENEFNSRVVDLVKIELERCGFRTVLVAPGDTDIPLGTRCATANNAKADFYLSVHANANTGQWGDWGGIETYAQTSGESFRVGKIIHKWLTKGTPLRDRGLKDGAWLYVLKNTKMPAVLVECAFMDNLKEANLLVSEAYRKECAVELAQAICEAYNIKYVPEPAPKPVTPAPPSTPSVAKEVEIKAAVKGLLVGKGFLDAQGRSMVEVRPVGNALGIPVGWCSASSQVVLNSVHLPSTVNRGGVGYAWSREVADAIGYDIKWTNATSTVEFVKRG